MILLYPHIDLAVQLLNLTNENFRIPKTCYNKVVRKFHIYKLKQKMAKKS